MKIRYGIFRPIFVTALLALGLSACSLPNSTATKTAAKASGSFSDGEILQVLQTLNEGEIAQAQLATQKSNNREIQETAEHIIRDHTQNNQRIQSMAQSGMKLEKSPLSRGLELQTEEIREDLAELSGTEFECTYLEKQIEQHQLALDTVRSELLPDAESPQVRRLLTNTAPGLQQHLQSAQETRNSIPQCATT